MAFSASDLENSFGLGKDFNFTPKVDESFFRRKPIVPVGKAVGWTGKQAFKATFGNPISRLGTGLLAGAIAGYASSDKNTHSGRLADTAKGAGVGLAAGLGANAAIWAVKNPGKASEGILKRGYQGAKFAGKQGWSMAKAGVNIASSVASFAMRHPALSIAGAAVGIGALALAKSGAGDTNASESVMNEMAIRRGISSTSSGGPVSEYLGGSEQGPDVMQYSTKARFARDMFQGSTDGLVQGLHRGRHG